MGKAAPVDSLNLERFLATIYVDPDARARFLASPETEACRAGLSEQQCLKLKEIDFTGLKMASLSFARKRAEKQAASASRDSGWWLKSLTSLSKREWFSLIFRPRAIIPETLLNRNIITPVYEITRIDKAGISLVL
jgi:hypothetical protein